MNNNIKGIRLWRRREAMGSHSLLVTRCPLLVLLVIGFACGMSYAQDSLNRMKDDTLSYFKPLKGRVISVDGNAIVADLGEKSGIKKGMRLNILKEGVPFLHPVTKEPMGRIETPTGKAEVKDVNPESSSLALVKGNVRPGDMVRMSEIKVRVLFYQDRSVDWNLGDSYYNLLKDTGRFEFIDTPLDSENDARILTEAKNLNADVALILTAKSSGNDTILEQRLVWVEDSFKIAQTEVKVDSALVKELQASKGFFLPPSSAGDALMVFDLTYGAQLIATGDVDGDGKQELIISTGKDIRVLSPGVSLEEVYNIKGSAIDNHVWMEVIDINSDGKDEVIVTSLRGNDVVSYVYELKGSEFSLIWKEKVFLRRLNNTLIAQDYSWRDGFDGPVYTITYEGGSFKKGSALKLPKGINIYDFVYLNASGSAGYVLAYDNAGFLNLYNSEGIRVWKSKEDYGGFLNSFGKGLSGGTADTGTDEWSVKNRLFFRGSDVFAMKRIPLAEVARGLGYKKSQIKVLLWTGFSVEERTLVDGIAGGIVDYALVGDRLIVLSRPLFGVKVKNILKGESPFGNMLYIYSLKGLTAK